MNTFSRVIRALMVRIIFMAYSLLCIWRVTFVSDNKYYWLMIISIGFLLIETAILLWLRAGKEFRGVLPSVLFFLSCILPGLWIMCIDESNRKNKFHYVAENQESKIKDYVSSLNSLISASNNNEDTLLSKVNSTTSSSVLSTTTTTLFNNLILSSSSRKNSLRSIGVQKFGELKYEALPLVASNLLLTSTKPSTTTTSTLMGKLVKRNSTTTQSQLLRLDENVDCCDVKISYSYLEDSLQNLLIQSLMLILITSRWLITRAELNLNQRSLILVISIATGADTVDFFSYLNLELIYRNDYLLYSTLLILSLSLLQFVFLHVEDSLNLTSSSSSSSSNRSNSSSHSNFSISNSTNNLANSNDDQDDILKSKKNQLKAKTKHLPFFYKHYLVIKNHIKSSSSSSSSNSSTGNKIETKTDPATTAAKNDCKQNRLIRIKLPSYNRIKKQNNRQAIINGYPMHKNNSGAKYFCYLFCCCIEQKDPLFFILLAGLFLHDGSYLTFRIFILSKLGWEATLNQSPSLVFFMVKNLFIIITQIYKVYTVTSERRQQKFYENYRDFVFATHKDNYVAINTNSKPKPSPSNNNNKNNMNNNNNSNLNNYHHNQNFNVALAAATGGQIPLVPINSFPTYPYPTNSNNHHFFMQQHLYQPAQTSNPYRFAQLYADVGQIRAGALRRSLSPNNRLNNRSVSTLGSVNTNLFADNHHNNNKQIKKKVVKSSKKNNNNQNTENNYYYRSNHLYKPSYQHQQQSPDSEIFYGVINDNNNKLYDQNITLCQTPTTGHANMSTPINPYLAKTSKPFYGVSFINRSRSSSALDLRDMNFRSPTTTTNDNLNQTGFNTIYGANYDEYNPYQRGNYNRSSQHNNNTAARLIKASKI